VYLSQDSAAAAQRLPLSGVLVLCCLLRRYFLDCRRRSSLCAFAHGGGSGFVWKLRSHVYLSYIRGNVFPAVFRCASVSVRVLVFERENHHIRGVSLLCNTSASSGRALAAVILKAKEPAWVPTNHPTKGNVHGSSP
jgi:hypothetical protein